MCAVLYDRERKGKRGRNRIREFPNQKQVRMMTAWLDEHEPGTFSFTGLVDPTDAEPGAGGVEHLIQGFVVDVEPSNSARAN